MTYKDLLIDAVADGRGNVPKDLYRKLITDLIETYIKERDNCTFRIEAMIMERAKAVKENDTDRVEIIDKAMQLSSLMARRALEYDNQEVNEQAKELLKR